MFIKLNRNPSSMNATSKKKKKFECLIRNYFTGCRRKENLLEQRKRKKKSSHPHQHWHPVQQNKKKSMFDVYWVLKFLDKYSSVSRFKGKRAATFWSALNFKRKWCRSISSDSYKEKYEKIYALWYDLYRNYWKKNVFIWKKTMKRANCNVSDKFKKSVESSWTFPCSK